MFRKLHLLPKEVKDRAFPEREQRIYDFMTANPIGVLSTVGPDGDPHGVVVYYDIGPDFCVLFLTRRGSKKYDNLIHDPRVMLTVYETKTQTTVQVVGTASEITDSSEINGVADRILALSLRAGGSGVLPVAKLDSGEYTGFRIRPVQVRLAVYAWQGRESRDPLFESIESFDLYE